MFERPANICCHDVFLLVFFSICLSLSLRTKNLNSPQYKLVLVASDNLNENFTNVLIKVKGTYLSSSLSHSNSRQTLTPMHQKMLMTILRFLRDPPIKPL